MKNWKIILPSLIATSSLPLVSLVSCGKTMNLLIDNWKNEGAIVSDSIDNVDDGTKCNYTIDMTKWGGLDPENYDYFQFFVNNNSIHEPPTHRMFAFKKDSFSMYVDGEKFNNWTAEPVEATDAIDIFIRGEDSIRYIWNATTITGCFIFQALKGGSTSISVDLYGHLNT